MVACLDFRADRFKILSRASDEELQKVQLELNGYALRWETGRRHYRTGVVAGHFQLPFPVTDCPTSPAPW